MEIDVASFYMGPYYKHSELYQERVVVSMRLQMMVHSSLRFSTHYRGRVLCRDIPELRLKRLDRLDPSPDIPDTHKFLLCKVPFRARFWRMTKDDRLVHKSPLMDIVGVTHETYATDLLHCWHRGPEEDWIAVSLWFIIVQGSSRVHNRYDYLLEQADVHRAVLAEIKVDLVSFYKWKHDTDEHWAQHGSEVQLPG